MQMLCKSFLMSEKFEGPHGHNLLKKGFLRVKYALNRFLVDTTWRCTSRWVKALPMQTLKRLWQNVTKTTVLKIHIMHYISFPTTERSQKCKKNHVNNVLSFIYWKQHQEEKSFSYWSLSWTNAVCTISCLFYWNVVIKLEPQLTQVGAN